MYRKDRSNHRHAPWYICIGPIYNDDTICLINNSTCVYCMPALLDLLVKYVFSGLPFSVVGQHTGWIDSCASSSLFDLLRLRLYSRYHIYIVGSLRKRLSSSHAVLSWTSYFVVDIYIYIYIYCGVAAADDSLPAMQFCRGLHILLSRYIALMYRLIHAVHPSASVFLFFFFSKVVPSPESFFRRILLVSFYGSFTVFADSHSLVK